MFKSALFAIASVLALAAAPAPVSAGVFTVTAGTVAPIAGSGNDFTSDLAGLGLGVKELLGSTVSYTGGAYKVELLGYENGFTDSFSVDGGVTQLGASWSGFANLFASPLLLGTSSAAPSNWLFKSAQSGLGVVGTNAFSLFGPPNTMTGDVFQSRTLYVGFNDGGGDGDHDDGILRISAVPEPSVWLTLIAGFGLVGVGMRRTRTRAVAA
jgi:hypothetical protein